MITSVSFLLGDNPDSQGTGNLPRALLYRGVTAIKERNNF